MSDPLIQSVNPLVARKPTRRTLPKVDSKQADPFTEEERESMKEALSYNGVQAVLAHIRERKDKCLAAWVNTKPTEAASIAALQGDFNACLDLEQIITGDY